MLVGKSLKYKNMYLSKEKYIENLKIHISNESIAYVKKNTLPKEVLNNINEFSGWKGGKTRKIKISRKSRQSRRKSTKLLTSI